MSEDEKSKLASSTETPILNKEASFSGTGWISSHAYDPITCRKELKEKYDAEERLKRRIMSPLSFAYWTEWGFLTACCKKKNEKDVCSICLDKHPFGDHQECYENLNDRSQEHLTTDQHSKLIGQMEKLEITIEIRLEEMQEREERLKAIAKLLTEEKEERVEENLKLPLLPSTKNNPLGS